jgi:hypothetical protein
MSLASAGASSNHAEEASVNRIDLESINGTSTTTERSHTPAKSSVASEAQRRNRRIVRCACCAVALTIAIIGLLALFCMRDPQWEVVETKLDARALRAMSIAAGTGDQTTEATLTMTDTLRIYNPNILGAYVEPKVAHMTYHGEEFAMTRLDPFTLRARSTTTVTANVSVHLSPDLAQQIAQDVTRSNGTLIVHTRTDYVAHTGIFRVHTGIQCKIWADVTPFLTGADAEDQSEEIVESNPFDIIKKKKCIYSKGL